MTSARTPVWKSIADTLRLAISNDHYAPGEKLPTEAQLSQRFGVNRHTVRHALAHLADEGLVHARRGAGVFILSKPIDYPLSGRVRFHQNLLAAGRLPDKKILSVELRNASESDARRLDLSPGDPVAVALTLSYADGTPVALGESCFPEARFPGLADALREEPGVTAALSVVGVDDYTRVSTRLTATIADPAQALHLRLREGAPLLFSEALSRGSDGLNIEYGCTWFASERITLTLDHET